MLKGLALQGEAGNVQPLPMKLFEMRGELMAAFRYLQSGSAIGKVVVRVEPSPHQSPVYDGQGAVLVTGGLGGLGLRAAALLVEGGASRVLLASRSGGVGRDSRGVEARLRSAWGTTEAVACDGAEACDIRALLSGGSLAGVLHAAEDVQGFALQAVLPLDRVRAAHDFRHLRSRRRSVGVVDGSSLRVRRLAESI